MEREDKGRDSRGKGKERKNRGGVEWKRKEVNKGKECCQVYIGHVARMGGVCQGLGAKPP